MLNFDRMNRIHRMETISGAIAKELRHLVVAFGAVSHPAHPVNPVPIPALLVLLLHHSGQESDDRGGRPRIPRISRMGNSPSVPSVFKFRSEIAPVCDLTASP